MVNTVITVRPARSEDSAEIAGVHDASWREAYRGVIPGRELERMIARRGPRWWRSAIRRGSNMLVLEFDESVAGYVTYGRNRLRTMPFKGELFELYLAPEYQGMGFGARLFRAARSDLARHGLNSLVVWALADNERAAGFYSHLGGLQIRKAHEKFGDESRERVAFGFE